MIRRPPRSPLFPYTRSSNLGAGRPDRKKGGVGHRHGLLDLVGPAGKRHAERPVDRQDAVTSDRKSTRLNSSHANISYAVFCLKKKNNNTIPSSDKPSRRPIT